MSELGWQAPLEYADSAELGELGSLGTEAAASDLAEVDGSRTWTSWGGQSTTGSWSDDTDFTNDFSYNTGGTEPLALADQLDATSDNTTAIGQEQQSHYDGWVYSELDIVWSDDSSDEDDTRSWTPSSAWSDATDSSVPNRVYSFDQAVPGTETNPVNHVAAIDLETLAAAGMLGGSTPTAASPSRLPGQIARGRGDVAPQNTGAPQVKVDAHMAGVTLATGTNTATILAEATAAAKLECPLCKRVCEDARHRLGLHWRTFGYNGPPYCARCASLFRAHIIRRDVSGDWCSRGKPCRSCSTVLHHFDKEALEDACRRIDEKTRASDAKRDLLTQTRGGGGMATAPCPYCKKTVAKSSMGLLW